MSHIPESKSITHEIEEIGTSSSHTSFGYSQFEGNC